MNFNLPTASVGAFSLAALIIFPIAATAQKTTAEGIAEYRARIAAGTRLGVEPADLHGATAWF